MRTTRFMKPLLAATAAGLVCAAAAGPAGAAPTAAPAKPVPKNTLNVMTLNLYLGGSLGDAINASKDGPIAFLAAAAKVYDTAIKTNFPLRAQWIAKTIKKQNPDVVSLNEVTQWIWQSTSGVTKPSYDFLEILQGELTKQGMNYQVASISENANIGYDANVGIPYFNVNVKGCDGLATVGECNVRLKDRDVILYNADNTTLAFNGNAQHGRYKKQTKFEAAGKKYSFDRGWASASFTYAGKPFTMITTHLEVESQDRKKPKKNAYGPKNWPSKVQVAQGKELLKIAKTQAKSTGGRVIVAGDLNSDANGYYSPTYANLTKKYFKDSWAQVGNKFGKAVGATCCQYGTLTHNKPLDSGDPVIPTRIDLVLNHGATAKWVSLLGTKKAQNSQPKWESDHYFYAAAVKLK